MINNQASHGRMTDIYFTDRRVNLELIRLLGGLVHEKVHAEAS